MDMNKRFDIYEDREKTLKTHMYVCEWVDMYIQFISYIYTYIYIYIYTFLHIWTYSQADISYIYIYIYIWTCIFIHDKCKQTHFPILLSICICMCTHTHTYIYIYIYIYIYTHTHTSAVDNHRHLKSWKVCQDVFIYIYIYTYIHTCVYLCRNLYIQSYHRLKNLQRACVYTHTYLNMSDISANTNVYTESCVCLYNIHAKIYRRINIYKYLSQSVYA